MKIKTLSLAVALVASAHSMAMKPVHDESSLVQAMEHANTNQTIEKIVFKPDANIRLRAPVIYSGSQPLTLVGQGATINGSAAGRFVLDDDLTAATKDGTLVFNTAGNITLHDLTVQDSATRGIVVNIPDAAEGDDIQVTLKQVHILGSALYGLHIDDNADEFDDGSHGSAIGIKLVIEGSTFIKNGTGAIDFDGIRVDERAQGSIHTRITNTQIDRNGGDGIELDEAGAGSVSAAMVQVTLNGNGFYNADDLDDGFDIDEAGSGNLHVTLTDLEVIGNQDEGLDFDEEGEGDVFVTAKSIIAKNNFDEAIKADEEGSGDLTVNLMDVLVDKSGDDGIQLTELEEGVIKGKLVKVKVTNSVKYGVKAEQWSDVNEEKSDEDAGLVNVNNVSLSGNAKGDNIAINNVDVK